MESSRDITAVSPSNNGGGDDIIEETIPDADSPSIRNRIACKTGHILNNLTSSVWYSYALLYLQNVVGLSALSVGIIFFISQTLMAVSFLVISFGHDKRLWKSFSPYGRRKARHIIGSAGVLLAWPFAFIPCLFCEDHSSNIKLGAYYLLSAALFSICWPLTEISYYSLMTEIRAENGKDSETSRSIVRVCKVCLYILLWALLQDSTEDKVNSNISQQFTHFAIILLAVGFLFVFAFHLTVLEPRPQAEQPSEGNPDEEKHCERSTADASSPSTMVNQEVTRTDRSKLAWFEWLKEPLLYKVGFVVIFSNITLRIVQSYLPLYLIETLQLRKESIAFFPLIIVISRIVTEITCKIFIDRLKPRVIILCTTSTIFGTCMWFSLQSASSLIYAPAVIFACMSSLLTMVTPTLHQEVTGNNKEAVSLVSGVFECTERILLGVIVLVIQMCYPGNKERSIGEYLRVAFPAAIGTCIVIPLIVATAFMSSKDSSEDPVLTIAAASPREENGPIVTSLPLANCVDRLASSEASTPPVDIEHSEPRRNSDCAELQGSPRPNPHSGTPGGCGEEMVDTSCSLSTAAPSDEEKQAHTQRNKDIEEVKRALDELHRLPSTDL
ncbi:Major facilitator super domain-containing protein 12 [Desmophyllum pertusum]|uniref:Major facilitator super domain-containing protein 12 n=1 Tax=Desmophyllum pertusum TaxID=174260 RepID=A0A9W9YQT0_9CNID|nr:Major facilitator super domain-containing protein 12 [Desmophyllum pertusum]